MCGRETTLHEQNIPNRRKEHGLGMKKNNNFKITTKGTSWYYENTDSRRSLGRKPVRGKTPGSSMKFRGYRVATSRPS